MLEQFFKHLINLDLFFFYFVNIHLKNPIFDILMPFVTYAGTQFFWIIFCGLLYLFGDEKGKNVAFLCLIVLFLGLILSETVKTIVARPRPDEILNNAFILMDLKGYSFPSGHSVAAFSALTILGIKYGHIYFFSLLAIMVAFSRIYLGVHYPLDVFVGALLGITLALLVIRLEDKLIKIKNKIFNQIN